jgi:hypothetical protein
MVEGGKFMEMSERKTRETASRISIRIRRLQTAAPWRQALSESEIFFRVGSI